MFKKIMVIAVAAIIILAGFLGIVFYLNATDNTLTVKTEAVTIAKMFGNDSTETDQKWLRFSFYSEDEMTAYRHCKESHDYHLSIGETVSDIVEVEDVDGKYYYFKAKSPIAE